MGRRSNFERKPRDFYPTPVEAVLRARDVFINIGRFVEPCAGDNALIEHIQEHCGHAHGFGSDIEPGHPSVAKGNALDRHVMEMHQNWSNLIITNPPWSWNLLKPMLDLWLELDFTVWLLLPADFAHNKRTSPFMTQCSDIVPVGRLKWEPGSEYYGKDNCAWYKFVPWKTSCTFHPRVRNDD